MKKLAIISLAALALAACSARDTTHHLPISGVYNLPEASQLQSNIKMSFGKSLGGKVVHTGVTNKKTNAVGKDDDKACNWAMLSALLQLQNKAKELGVTKISNIQSYYKKNAYSSTDKFECHAGRTIAGVALKADFVK